MNAEQIMALLDRPIAYQRPFVSLGCGVTGAVMLSQAMYWTPRASGKGGWFYKTQAEWEAETGLTRAEQESTRKKLRGIGVLLEKRQGVPAKLWFKVDTIKLYGLLQSSMQDSCNLECGIPANKSEGFPQTITESTTENTTETTSDIKQHVQNAVDEAFEHFWLNMALSKKNKAKAKQVFTRQVKALKVEPMFFADQLIEDTKRRKNDFGFDKLHPTTYLNNHRWEDELDKPSQPKQQGNHFDYSVDQSSRLFGGQ